MGGGGWPRAPRKESEGHILVETDRVGTFRNMYMQFTGIEKGGTPFQKHGPGSLQLA